MPQSKIEDRRTFRTERQVRAVKPPAPASKRDNAKGKDAKGSDERVEYWDEVTSGLGLRVSTSGRKTWILMYRVRGEKRPRRATLGTYPTLSLADAREQAGEDLRAAAKGRDPATERKTERDAETFGELAARYLERHAKKHKRSWFKDEQALNRDLLPRFKHRKPASIRRREVIELLEDIAARGAPVGANRTLEILRRLYNWAIEREYVTANPCHRIPKIGVEKRRERVLSDDEIRAIWSALGEQTENMAALFRLRLLTAQRPGEVSKLRKTDLDLESGWWTIPPEFSKNGRAHRVPLSEPALAIIKERLDASGDSEWLLPSPTGEGPLRSDWRALEEIRDKTKIKDFRPHDLRRTAASRMTGDLGIARLTVGKILNHVDAGVTATYDRHAYDAEKRQALDAWAKHLTAILAREKAASNVVSLKTSELRETA